MNLIRCEEKWVFFNNETFFNVALLKLFWFDCQIHYFVRDYDGFQLNSGLFSCGMNILLELYFFADRANLCFARRNN